MLVEGKKLLVTGVLTRESIAFAAARALQDHGAELVLTSFGRAMGLTEKSARRLPSPVDVLEMDANDPDQIASVAGEIGARWGRLDGFLHAIAFAPQDALGGNFLRTPWESVGTAIQTSAYSLKAIAVGMLPYMKEHGGAIVSLDFDARVAWPIYDWMGVAKASLESITRYLARDLGPHAIRVNTLSAGPLRTIAGKGIPGFQALADGWDGRAPLGWDPTDASPVADAIVFLLSDLSRGITGEMVHVDGGYHAIGSAAADVATSEPPASEAT
jgi:meromycolic acid enoyl-[acyl-carrier-protein] reductase